MKKSHRAKKPSAQRKARPTAAPKAPPAQAGDDPEVARPKATPAQKLPSEEQAKAELDANPGRTSALSDKGHVVREG